MNDERLAELREKYKDRNLIGELEWGTYANHSGYQSKSNGEFINWMCNMAYRMIKAKSERKTGKWIKEEQGITVTSYRCSECGRSVRNDTGYDVSKDYPFCHCGAKMEA